MELEEAIDRIKKRVCCEKPVQHFCTDGCMSGPECCEFSIAIYAIEMQIPKKVGFDNHYGAYICPECDNALDENNACDWCPSCGQKLKWSK